MHSPHSEFHFKIAFRNVLDDIYEQSADLLCSDKCPCKLNAKDSTFDYLQSVKPHLNYSSAGALNVLQCKEYPSLWFKDQLTSTFQSYFKIAEEKINCAGFCKKSPIFVFSNINNGEPTQYCFHIVRALVFRELELIIRAFLFNALIMGVVILLQIVELKVIMDLAYKAMIMTLTQDSTEEILKGKGPTAQPLSNEQKK